MPAGHEKAPMRSKTTEARKREGAEIVDLKNKIKEDLARLSVFAETLGKEAHGFDVEQFVAEMRTLRDADAPAFLEKLTKKCEPAAEQLSRPALEDLAHARPKEISDRVQWTMVVSGGNDEIARLATLEKALSLLVAVRGLRVLDHYLNAFTIIFAALPKLQKPFANLLKMQTMQGAFSPQTHQTLSAAIANLPPALRELVERGVNNQLGMAGELITSTIVNAKQIGLPVKAGSGKGAMAEASRWVDLRNRLGKLVNPSYVLTSLEETEPKEAEAA